MRFLLSLVIIMQDLNVLQSQESAQYLHNAIRDLKHLQDRQGLKRIDASVVQALIPEIEPITTTTQQPVDKRIQVQGSAPPLSLTKGELAALYEAAVAKGETIKLDTGDNSFVHAAVHELDESPSFQYEHKSPSPLDETAGNGGYYYYYYPIKSFLDEMVSQSSTPEQHYSSSSISQHEVPQSKPTKPNYQYHSHTHQHNVKISSTAVTEDKKEKKSLEPLFMAISGFIGMALMFVLSVVVFPKFGIKKSPSAKSSIKKSERITDIARVALQAIEGKDCRERFACELEKTARAFHLQDNRFVKMLKRYAPATFGKQLAKNKRLKCTAIPCKKKPPPPAKKKLVLTSQKKP